MKPLTNIEKTSHVLIVDALRYSLSLEKQVHAGLWRTLRRIEATDNGRNPSEGAALSAIGNAWEILDVAHRIRGLVLQVPMLKQNTPEVQIFLRGSKQVEDFRHFYQHLNSELPNITGTTTPVMGVLSWETRNPLWSITIWAGTGRPDISAPGLALDTRKGRFVSKLYFSAGGQDINLEQINVACQKFGVFFEKWLSENGKLGDGNASIHIMRFGLQWDSVLSIPKYPHAELNNKDSKTNED